jgi:FdhD protein
MPADQATPPVFQREWFERVAPDGTSDSVDRAIADETPVAIEVNGLGYAVLMASASDLVDLAYGFALAERLIDRRSDIVEVESLSLPAGLMLRITLIAERSALVTERVRHRISESSCGLCGIENLEQALRPLPRVTQSTAADDAALFRSLARLRDHQPLGRETGAVHAAALAAADGEILLVREDVGRHNAFDKLIGAMLRTGTAWDGGFALLTSRCSYELVEKAVLADCPLLVTISAPTGLALARAGEAGLRLAVLARPDAILRKEPCSQPAAATAVRARAAS